MIIKNGNMPIDGFDYYIEDSVGGIHTDGVGYAPDGTFCGECNKSTCVGCEVLKKTGAEFVVSEDQWLHDEDWVRCEDCIYNDDCAGMEYNDGGCYSGEKMEEV